MILISSSKQSSLACDPENIPAPVNASYVSEKKSCITWWSHNKETLCALYIITIVHHHPFPDQGGCRLCPFPWQHQAIWHTGYPLTAWFMGPTWGPSGTDRTQVDPMLAPWTLLSGLILTSLSCGPMPNRRRIWTTTGGETSGSSSFGPLKLDIEQSSVMLNPCLRLVFVNECSFISIIAYTILNSDVLVCAAHLFGNTENTITIGDFTGIGSAYRPDPTIGSGLTPDNKGTRYLCLFLTNRSPRKLEARGDSK